MSSLLGPRVAPEVIATLRAYLDQGRALVEQDGRGEESPGSTLTGDLLSSAEGTVADPTSMPTILGATSVRQGERSILRTEARGRPYSAPGGVPRVERMTALMDDVLGRLAVAAHEALEGRAGDVVLLALGGYGRHELGLRSDVDVLFLVSEETAEESAQFAEVVLYALWDLGVEVGHAVRTLSSTLDWAKSEQSVLSSLLDARLIPAKIGPADVHLRVFDQVERGINELVARPDIGQALVQAKLDEAQKRHARYGETVYLLEPNVKESAGGLRDLHVAQWIARVRYKTHGIHQLLKLGVLSPEEHRALLRAYDFLLRVRFELHRITKRRQDNLRFEQQEKIAQILGYQDAGKNEHERNKLGVERFMRAYYFHARQIRIHSRAIVERATHVPPKKGQRPRMAPRGFRFWGDQLTVKSADQFATDPSAMVRIFDVAQEENIDIHPYAKHLLFENRRHLDQRWRRDRNVVDPFLSILENPHHDDTWLGQMHDVGLLKSLIPEMGRVTGRWQHSLYHVYTVDIHSLKVFGWAKRIRRGDYLEKMPALTHMLEELARPCILYLACLLHDIGKGWRREDHSVRGAKVARVVGDRLSSASSPAWTEEETADLVWLVKDHLLMSDIAQRRDVSDTKLVQQFAEAVGSEERLEMLYLLTVVDMMGTSPRVWNSWKASLLRELYVNTRAALRSNDGLGARRHITARRRRAQTALVAEFGGGKVAEEQAKAFFSVVPDRYLLSISRHRMARHVRMWSGVRSHGGLATHVNHVKRDGLSTFTVVSRDRPGLLAAVAGVLAANDLSILSASVFSVPDGVDVLEVPRLGNGSLGDYEHVHSPTRGGNIALDVLHVTDARGGTCDDRERWSQVRSELELVLLDHDESYQEILRRAWKRKGITKHRPAVKAEVKVVLDQGEEVVIDVFCEDHLGILWLISHTLAEQGLAVTLARVSTQGHRVADGFYVRDAKTGATVDEKRVHQAAGVLREVLQQFPDIS